MKLLVAAIVFTVIIAIVFLIYFLAGSKSETPKELPPDPQTAIDILDSINQNSEIPEGEPVPAVIESPQTAEVPKDPEVAPVITKVPPLVIPSDGPKIWGSSRNGIIQTDTVGRREVGDIKYIESANCPSHITQFFSNSGSGVYAIGAVCDDGSRIGPWGGNEGDKLSTEVSASGFKNVPVMYNYDFIGTFFGMGTNKKSFGDKSKPANLTCPDGTRVSGLKGQYTDRLRNIGLVCSPY